MPIWLGRPPHDMAHGSQGATHVSEPQSVRGHEVGAIGIAACRI